eukprot:8297414-Karenia_brevis.AAC.1
MQTNLNCKVEDLVGGLHKSVTKQLATHEERMSRQDKDIEQIQREVAQIKGEMREFNNTLATDSVTDATVDPSYD